eukprot:TRINITY_DN2282_c0_g2::TRINITY_DN2282_c0_g2_i1::g.6851::m.6851 TRINITY_DN2282_c0_g2::TRINITY_DN2282_c0_g2_i1::g.6851  ORF type:complete len:838 (-),score=368.98,sp/O75366/AVIL_HUMAN/40.36/0.0,Gelsolin/PF00626.17/1.1e-17,Gelsolin/PF00626.17/3.6e-16,Gelsolin/PF00626.17/2.5e-10,Gelsolin/PF00626.17/4.5e-18,Gelsolin/PF00626.17/2.1e-09,Gelsolin/PF00626.17/3.1e-09,VHP/PF02209.14/7.7e+03,VHP/PF02209.14/8.2e-14,Viral_helicase1/PF01443.13/0.15 TRINITY_DN2282_c0_g2_i1:57-2528(-)
MSAAELFAGAGQKEGVEIWRIEKLKPVRLAKESYGKFHSGDSYLVLNTYKKFNSMNYNLHFWLGKDSSQDEQGAAAILTAELDQFLGDLPVQFREVQEHESKEFLQIFKNGIQYCEGGVESGFKKVERDQYETRLLHIKGSRNVRVFQVEPKASSLNSGDVFVVDSGLTLYQWNGKDASRKEKAKALDITQAINSDERGGRARITAFDEGQETPEFWAAIGGKGPIKSAAEGGSDEEAEAKKSPAKLYKVSDQSGSLSVEEIQERPLKREFLKTDDVFILVAGGVVYAWVGKGASAAEKKAATPLAVKFIQQQNMPNYTPVSTVKEGTETPLFKQNFQVWEAPKAPSDFSAKASGVAKVQHKDFDVSRLMLQRQEEDALPDDGTGKLKIWRIENFQKVDWPESQHGQFYAGDSFIVLYSYKKASKEEHIIYFWQGKDSSQDERGASAILAAQLDSEMGGSPVQCRVVQDKEPAHFYSLFKGKMIVHTGGKASAFKNRGDSDSYDNDGVYLYHVRGTTEWNTRAVQVPEDASALNSGDVFVLVANNEQYVWYGQHSSDAERAVANNVANVLKKNVSAVHKVNEGEEPEAFWAALGGKKEYPSFGDKGQVPREPRLFQLSNATGNVEVDEVFNFAQTDLCDDDVMLLDTYNEVFVWVGSQANETEKKEAVDVARKYVAQMSSAGGDGRDADTPILRIQAGQEPKMFTCHFLGWDPAQTKVFVDPYQAKLAALKASQGAAPEAAAPAPVPVAAAAVSAECSIPVGSKFFPYEELKAKRGALGVDTKVLELYLSDADFQAVFKISKSEFTAMPKWKQDQKKKEVQLW